MAEMFFDKIPYILKNIHFEYYFIILLIVDRPCPENCNSMSQQERRRRHIGPMLRVMLRVKIESEFRDKHSSSKYSIKGNGSRDLRPHFFLINRLIKHFQIQFPFSQRYLDF